MNCFLIVVLYLTVQIEASEFHHRFQFWYRFLISLIVIIVCLYNRRCSRSIDVQNNEGCSEKCRNDRRGYGGYCISLFCNCKTPKGVCKYLQKSKI